VKRKIILSILFTASVALIGGCAANQSTSPPEEKAEQQTATHPELTEQEQYIACADCHKTETPEIYEQWFQSGHGIGMVKCYQCHGTYEDLQVVPETANCAVCHSGEFHRTPADSQCWTCHPAHTFVMHK